MEQVHIVRSTTRPGLTPSIESFRQTFSTISSNYQEIIAILGSSGLSPAVEHAQLAVKELRLPINIQIIDSQTTAVGLGVLVQTAAESIQHGIASTEICNQLRAMVRNIFAIFCLPDLTSLSKSGQIDQAQAIVGEMLGIVPIFVMENGHLIYIQKIRNPRHLIDTLFEFVMEFDRLKFLALLRGETFFDAECHHLRERITQNLRSPHLCEYAINPAVATLLGPRTIGIISVQALTKERL